MLHRLELQDVLQDQQHLLYGRQPARLRKTQEDAYLSSTMVPPLLRFRSELAPSVWDSIAHLFQHQAFPEALDVDCTYGKAAIELARRCARCRQQPALTYYPRSTCGKLRPHWLLGLRRRDCGMHAIHPAVTIL
jgi:hypothetical protein